MTTLSIDKIVETLTPFFPEIGEKELIEKILTVVKDLPPMDESHYRWCLDNEDCKKFWENLLSKN
jgi:hypothetical protein